MDNDDQHIPAWVLPAVFAALVLLLYILPHAPTEAMEIHQAITGALRAGNNWGRQALVGNTDYPALQSLCLLVCEAIAAPVRLSGAHLMCALAQAWILLTFIRLLRQTKRHYYFVVFPFVMFTLIPFIRADVTWLDPNWIAAVPAAAIVYHLVLWKETKNLRSLIVASAASGILCLCGIAGLLIGCCTALFLYFIDRHDLAEQGKSYAGMKTLLWSTALYCIAIWLLWNWLVMDDILFGLRDLFARLSTLNGSGFSQKLLALNPVTLSLVAFFFPLLILCLKSDNSPIAKCLIAQIVLLVLTSALSNCLQIPATGVLPLAATVILATYSICCITTFKHPVSAQACMLAMVLCFFIAFRAESLTKQSIRVDNADNYLPPREEITAFIDQFWPQSRTMLYGLKLPAAYPDPSEKRFVARLDFQQDDLLNQETDEQLHILIPPPDGKYYPKNNSPLADIYANGRDWLILEKQWPSGCQLWRVVPPPENESKLKFLE